MAEGSGNPMQAGMKAAQEMLGGAVAAQQRSVGLAQDWTQGVIDSYKNQAESYEALMEAMKSSLEALETTLKSQEETNKALRQSLDAYRGALENASQAQERNMQLAQSFFDDIVGTLSGQLESSRSLLLEPAARQQEFFQNVTQEWLDAYTRLLNAPMEFYKAGAQRATGRGGEGA
ncbi:MAG: hypothetical protein M3Q49_14390 [Actinomycetota bacterium]|jgi:predicted  nucleic acid-binding Zn-ribbon protein|nr:hypothetical protein [Actinomycetota bacterium]MDP9486949.1 hypothetical protein [Actinomycetota bacterium]PLS85881.1 MAG: hypothetical protein CYG60_10180 [Actinomycetota bacterium]